MSETPAGRASSRTGLSDGPQIEANIQTMTSRTSQQCVRHAVPNHPGAHAPQHRRQLSAQQQATAPTRTMHVRERHRAGAHLPCEQYDTHRTADLPRGAPGVQRRAASTATMRAANIIAQSGAHPLHHQGRSGSAKPLLIRHERLDDTYEHGAAVIRWRPTSAISSGDLLVQQVYWTTDTAAGFAALPMTDQGGNTWAGAIPAQRQAPASSTTSRPRPTAARCRCAPWWRPTAGGTSACSMPTRRCRPWMRRRSYRSIPTPPPPSWWWAWSRGRTDRLELRLLDATGRLVHTVFRGVPPADGRLFVDIATLPVGVYQLELRSASGRSARTLLKQ
jgi:hypothetical protein